MDSVRFVKPVRIGDTVGVKLEVGDKRVKGKNGLVTLRCEVRNRKGENVVIADLLFLVALRDT
jgi:acyl dehydratase